MSPELIIYLISIASNFVKFLWVVIAFLTLFLMIDVFIFCIYDDTEFLVKNIRKKASYYLSMIVLCLIGILLTPAQGNLYLIAGTHYLRKSDIPDDAIKLFNQNYYNYLRNDKKEVD